MSNRASEETLPSDFYTVVANLNKLFNFTIIISVYRFLFFLNEYNFIFSLREFLEKGNLEDFNRLKMYFERKEIVVAWFKENSWLHTLLGDFVMRPLRPACLSSDLSSSHFSSDCVSGLVQR